MSDYFKLQRGFLELNWFDKPEMFALFMHVLACAKEQDTKNCGLTIHRGQMKTSLGQLSDATELSKMTLRTCIKKLKDWELIDTESCNRHTIITIRNYDDYFDVEKPKESSREEKKAAITPPPVKKDTEGQAKAKKTKEELAADTEKRMAKFYQELVPYVETYGKDMVRQFYDYWSETNKSKSRMRFEQQTTWNLNLRLQRWARQQAVKGEKSLSTALHNSESKDYTKGGW